MTKITIQPDCANAPKKALIRDFNIAFAEGNGTLILDYVDEDIFWCVYGDFEARGKEVFTQEIHKMLQYPLPTELVIESIITHGSEAAANGYMVMGENTYAFCDVYQFKSAGSSILKSIKSYIVKV